MLRAFKSIFVLFLCVTFVACSSDYEVVSELDNRLKNYVIRASQGRGVEHFVLPECDDYDAIPQDIRNPLNEAKIELGKMLFFEPGIGVDAKHDEFKQTFSCSSCHLPNAGFRPGKMQGVADGGEGIGINGEGRYKAPIYEESEMDVQGIRPLSVLNVAFVQNTQWSGQFGNEFNNEGLDDLFGVYTPESIINHSGLAALEAQNIEGLKLHRMLINPEIVDSLGYKDLFDAAFPEVDQDKRYTLITGSFAISAYLRQLLSNRAPFQEWLKGNHEAMTEEQKRGAILFFDKANCYACHHETNLGSDKFYAIGVNDLDMIPSFNRDPNDRKNMGRGGFTNREEDMFKFRVPQLYNLEGNPFYFHGSSKNTLEEVVDYFNDAIPENARVTSSQISHKFQPLNLSDEEKSDLVAFLRVGLQDPDLIRYQPEEVLSGMCFPNNDPVSRNELGCD